MIICTNCAKPYPNTGVPFLCPDCEGIYDATAEEFWHPKPDEQAFSGIWRYRNTLNLPKDAPSVSLGEGNTPLVWCEIDGNQIGFKCEFINPSGSYKDRGAAVLASLLLQRGVKHAIEDSSGNAGAAFAAYAARAGIRARIVVPAYAAGPKIHQIKAYGAEVIPVEGTREDVAEATLKAAKAGEVYASHAYLPHVMAGYATIAYELVEQLGKVPGSIVLPVGQGSLLLGVGRGFLSMLKSGIISHLPRLIGVQSQACDPLVQMFIGKQFSIAASKETNYTLAEGVRIQKPLRPKAVIELVQQSQGSMVAVNEPQLINGYMQLAKLGFFVEPTSALIWEGIKQAWHDLIPPIIGILTGSGLKATPPQKTFE